MTKRTNIFIDSSEVRDGIEPVLDESVKCEFHPDAGIGHGFGLAGGGFGPYTYCSECGVILSKQMLNEE